MATGIDTANLALLSIASMTNLILAMLIFIYSKRKQSWWFAGAIIAVVGWTIVNYLADNTQNPEWALVWTKMTFSTTAFVAWFLLLFALVFPEYKKPHHWLWPVGLFLPNLLIHLLLFGEDIVQGIEQYEGGVIVTFGPWLHLFTVYFLGCLLSAIGLLIWKLYKNEGENRKRVGYILTGLAIFLFFSTVMNFIIPVVFGYFYTSVFGPYFAVFFTGLTTVAIIRYRLLGVRLLAPQIFTLFIGAILFVEIFIAESSTQILVRSFIFAWYAALAYLLIRGIQREARLVDELQEANVHLKELMEIKTEFLQIASHQLRTPLTSLRGLLEMQAEGGFDTLSDDERRGLQQDMNHAANNLNNIVNDLLDAMELEGGRLNFTWEQVDVTKLIQETMNTLKPSYDKKDLTLRFETNKSLPAIQADEGYLRQVFLNIINNAEKYTQKGGLVITSAVKDDHVELTFQDTGIGIEASELSKLFGKFVRGKKSALMHTDGSGLGLFIMKKIVEEHHGHVLLKSEGLGKGSTVHVILPIRQPT